MNAPSRRDVKEWLVGLLTEEKTREEVAGWAAKWIRMDDPDVEDTVVWSALRHLAGADLQMAPGEYLHHDPEFHAWLDELEDTIGRTSAQ
jgi:hypothetical protein